MGTSSGALQALLLGMRPHDPRCASLSFSNCATELDGTLGCVTLVSPVTDPLGRYQYAKCLRDDCTPPAGMAERVAPMHDMYWVIEVAMAEAAPARFLAGGERTDDFVYLSTNRVSRSPCSHVVRTGTWLNLASAASRCGPKITRRGIGLHGGVILGTGGSPQN